MPGQWFIGLDGGGTKTTAVAVDNHGNFLGSCVGKGINFYAAGMSVARDALKSLLEHLFDQVGARDYAAVFIGMSALDDQPSYELVKEFCSDVLDPQKVEMCSDVFAGLYGLSLGQPGVMLISGTGMIGTAISKDGEIHVTGGWGYALSDEGSCFYIGHEGLKAAIRDVENLGGNTILTQRALDFYKCKNLRELIPKIYEKDKVNNVIAAFAQEVIVAADRGDIQSRHIIQNTIDVLVTQAVNLMQKLGTDSARVGVYGGLFEHHPAVFEEFKRRLNLQYPYAEVMFPEISPEYGAILYGLSLRKPEGWKEMQQQIAKTACIAN